MTVHVVTVFNGEKYDPACVEIVHDMVARNLSRAERRHWCLTDRPEAMPEGVEPIASTLPGWWAKVELFSPKMPWAPGDRVVYFDLDVVITGRLEDLVERPGIIADWNWPCYNSSVMVWNHGDHAPIWHEFEPGILTKPARNPIAALIPAGQINGGDQEWITEVSRWDTFPPGWCLSRHQATGWPPTDCKVVVFHGALKPTDVRQGWVADVYKVGGFTSLPTMDGANVDTSDLIANVRVNAARDLNWFTGAPPHKQTAVLVAGGPSMRASVQAIKDHKRRGARIVSVNNAWRFLVENGITPDSHILLDARPENIAFVEGAPTRTRYLVASQVHPSLIDSLQAQDCRVVLWHNAFGDSALLKEAVAPHLTAERLPILVPGGGTVGLRSLWLLGLSGFRKVHVYGMDSSFDGDAHHAYPQALNDDDVPMTVVLGGKSFRAARWMVRQAEEFKWHWRDLRAQGVRLHVHGKGLIPEIARRLERGER